MTAVVLYKKQPPRRSHLKRELYKLLIARTDIHAAHDAVQLFHNNVRSLRDPLYYPLFTAIVVCYSRPFTNNKPYGALPARWAQYDNTHLQELHDDILKARHEMIAHSDLSVRKARIVPKGVVVGQDSTGKKFKSAGIGTESNYYLFRVPRIIAISKLTADRLNKLHDEIEDLTYRLYADMELPPSKFPLRVDDGL